MLRYSLPRAIRCLSHRNPKSLFLKPSTHQSINRSIHQSIRRCQHDFAQHKIPLIRVVDPSTNQPTNHAIHQIHQPVNQSTNQSTSHATNQSISHSVNDPILSNNQSINQSIEQPIEFIPASALADQSTNQSIKEKLNLPEWSKLVKFELSVLAASSCIFGYYLAGGSLIAILSVNGLLMLGGTVLNAFSAIILNQIIERKYDAMMERTRRRPLVVGTISIPAASAGCLSFATAGAGALYLASGGLAAPAVALSTVVLYAFVYTPLKRITVWNTEVGALVGSLPVWVGAACALPASQLMDLSPATLSVWLGFAFMSVWQMPHFMMIAYQYAAQYKRAGFVMRAPAQAPTIGLAYTASFLLLPLLGFHLNITSPSFLVTGTILSSYLLLHYSRFVANPSVYKARGPIYIFFVFMFAAICLHSNTNDDIDDGITRCLQIIDQYVVQLPSCVLNWKQLKPNAMKDNSSFWQSLPSSVHAICGKTYHDRMIRDNTLPGACPVVQVQRVKQGNSQMTD